MSSIQKIHTFFISLICLLSFLPVKMSGQEKETEFRITVLKTSGEPQQGVILKITGKNDKYFSDEKGIISFRYEINPAFTRTANLYFPGNETTSVATLSLEDTEVNKTFYLDRPEDIAAFKQSNRTIPVEGFVKDEAGKPIAGAVVSIQGTGRKALSDEIGLFHIEADYSHPITVRAPRMENRSLDINVFLQHPEEPYTVRMRRKNATRIYSVVEQMPEYPGGMKAFMRYLKRNLVYPPQAKKDKIEGVVAIQFVVEKDGRITSPAIVRSLQADMDTAALNVVRNMPNWIPGRDHGMRVRCKYSVPVQFKIELPKPAPQKPAIPADSVTLGKDTLQTDSLATDSLRKVMLPNDSLKTDSLQLKADSMFLKGDSLLLRSDSLLVANDSIAASDSIAKAKVDNATDKPKKRNIFVRFFRWLFGKKD